MAWIAGKLGIPPWGSLLIGILVPMFGFVGKVLWRDHQKLSKIEDAVRVLASHQPQDQNELIRDLLSRAADDAEMGDVTAAVLATQLAAKYMNYAKKREGPAPGEFSQGALAKLERTTQFGSSAQLSEAAFKARIALAEYRSALNPAPALA